MKSVINPFVYIWVNIDSRGRTKCHESQNIAVGPPGILPGSDTLGHKGLKGYKRILLRFHLDRNVHENMKYLVKFNLIIFILCRLLFLVLTV